MTTLQTPTSLKDRTYRFSLVQFQRMAEEGLFGRDRVELLEGVIVYRMPPNPPHDGTISLVNQQLSKLLPKEWFIRIQSSITTTDSQPLPDLAVVREPLRRYVTVHPVAKDIAILIEVADSSVTEDRTDKGRIYARARIPVYWIVNIPERQVEVYTRPRSGQSPAYRARQDFSITEIVPVLIDEVEVGQLAVRDLLP